MSGTAPDKQGAAGGQKQRSAGLWLKEGPAPGKKVLATPSGGRRGRVVRVQA